MFFELVLDLFCHLGETFGKGKAAIFECNSKTAAFFLDLF